VDAAARLRIGIDVGGTNTDAVLMDERSVVEAVKTPTTPDVTTGIVAALRELSRQAAFDPGQVLGVMIGTTHFTNAVMEARALEPTAAIRLGLPATRGLPLMVDWPQRLARAIGGHRYLCHGGHEFDGREIAPLDPDKLRQMAADLAVKDIRSLAITSVFSPVNAAFEEAAAELLH
jgi:N-methylhydantoinase A/oxoprolinase/acetone carboxylase beta subunit